MTLRIAAQPAERRPAWVHPSGPPRYDAVRWGVLYGGLSVSVLASLPPPVTCIAVFAAVGPKLSFARSDAPWIPYDRLAWDQNEECEIRDRPLPWNLGDEVWCVLRWQGTLRVALHFWDEGTSELWLAPAIGGPTDDELVAAVEAWARERAGDFVERVPALSLTP